MKNLRLKGGTTMNKLTAFKLRMSLLKIWFIKNLIVFIKLSILISVVLILTGQVDQNTPVLGIIFGELSIAINEILSQRYSDDIIVNFITIIITLLVTIGTLSSNLKRIALSDIKNPELKKMLIRAGLYFNRDGKLVKKIEIATKIDLDGDNKIGDEHIHDIPSERFVPSLKRSIEELGTILTVKIESESEINEIKRKADLEKTALAIKEIIPTAVQSAEKVSIEKILENTTPETREFRKNIIKTGLVFIGKSVSSMALSVKNAVVTGTKTTGKFIKFIALSIGGFFKKLFTKKERVIKVKVEKTISAIQPKIEPVIAAQSATPQMDALEALRRKYGK